MKCAMTRTSISTPQTPPNHTRTDAQHMHIMRKVLTRFNLHPTPPTTSLSSCALFAAYQAHVSGRGVCHGPWNAKKVYIGPLHI